MVHTLYVYAYTFNELDNVYFPIEIEVCGYERLDNTLTIKEFDLV